MRRFITVFAAALALAGCGGDGAKEGSSDGAITVELKEVNGSGETGTAELKRADSNSFFVSLKMENMPESDANQPAHIHNVSCDEYAKLKDFNAQLGTVSYPLEDVLPKGSRTKVSVPLESQATGKTSINVHKPRGDYPAVACGDIPER
jgi:hypothetical protein